MTATVVVVGGGYGGAAVAKALDEVADVVLVEPRDAFVHNVAALRGLVDPAWTEQIFLPYDALLTRGRVVRGRAAGVDPHGVTLASGERIGADYVVLATGSEYPFPAKFDLDESAAAIARLHGTRAELARAERVLLLGAGPVGLELAGEIAAAWPDKHVAIVDPADDVVSGPFPDEFRAELRGQLDELGVELLLGTALVEEPVTAPGETKTFTVTTAAGREITADIWFRCHGIVTSSEYLDGPLAAARRPDGQVEVAADLRVPGHTTVFAIGDVAAVAEAKGAKSAEQQAAAVAAAVTALIEGGDVADYVPGPPGISLPLGPTGGASYAPSAGVLGAEATSHLKGATMRIGLYRTLFGVS